MNKSICVPNVEKKIIKTIAVEFKGMPVVDHILIIDSELYWYLVMVGDETPMVVDEGMLSLSNYISEKVEMKELEKRNEESTVGFGIIVLNGKY